MKYVMIEIDCPECGGEGYVERMTWLTYDGAQTWVRNQCHECHGDKIVEAPARCAECGDEILLEDMRYCIPSVGWYVHEFCVDSDTSMTIIKCPKCAYSNMKGAPECEKCGTPLDKDA